MFIVNKVLSTNEQVRRGTDPYVEVIIVNDQVVDCKTVIFVVGIVWFRCTGQEQGVVLTLSISDVSLQSSILY